ncbi:MAG TPA: hypothetical protein PLZ55_09935, partial [bacterium]|nr:hypothetical protein [bacterium]
MSRLTLLLIPTCCFLGFPLQTSAVGPTTYEWVTSIQGEQMQYYSGITGSDSSVHIIGYRSGKVDVYSPSGFYFTSWGVGSGSGDGQLYQAQGIARDEAGNFYIADTGNNRVQTFSPDGFYFKKWGIQGSGDGQFSSPRGIAVGPGSDPAVYVADTGNNRV